jgi:hypothetical protein
LAVATIWLTASTTTGPAEGGEGLALAYLVVTVVLLLVFGPLAFLIGRDANRRGKNGWAWGLLFFWQPVIVGIAYLSPGGGCLARQHQRAGIPIPVGECDGGTATPGPNTPPRRNAQPREERRAWHRSDYRAVAQSLSGTTSFRLVVVHVIFVPWSWKCPNSDTH